MGESDTVLRERLSIGSMAGQVNHQNTLPGITKGITWVKDFCSEELVKDRHGDMADRAMGKNEGKACIEERWGIYG